MPILARRWNVRPACPADHLARLAHLNLNEILVQVLYNRGVTTPEDVETFISGTQYYRAAGLRGMDVAVDRIRWAVRRGESIAVYGDFDADGVTSTALAVQLLRAFGVRVSPYIPHRVDEGYGLNCDALEQKIKPWGADLVITVDCGIRSNREVAFARELGMDIIVTDHHDVGWELPEATAVINPKQQGCEYQFKELSGVGIAYKLAEALLDEEERDPVARGPVTLKRDDLVDLVALGTVADIVPLLRENRSLVKRGLEQLRRPRRLGIQAMMNEARLAPEHVDAYAIGFILGPRLNAAGRLESARVSYDVLTTQDPAKATELAARLGALNRQRQQETQALVAQVRAELAGQGADRYLYLSAGRDYRRGIVGLAAGRLAEELYRPVLVAELNDDTVTGSARSIPEFNITAALDKCKADDDGILIRYGGHAMAAGFTAPASRLLDLRERLEALAREQLSEGSLQAALDIDAEVSLEKFDYATQEVLAQLEPCGHDNPLPVFCSRNLRVVDCRVVGSDGQHLKLAVVDPAATGLYRDRTVEAIAFRHGEWYARLVDRQTARLDLAYTLQVDQFNGERRLQLNVVDIRES